jgi:copper chaperone
MSDNHYLFDVKMSCSGCSNAINRVLSKKEENKKIDISLENQTVDVITSLPYEDVLAAIKKTGKEVIGGKVL